MKGLRELEEVGVYLDFLSHSSYFFKGFFFFENNQLGPYQLCL